MKKLTIILTAILFTALSTMAQVAINKDGTDPNASAILDVKATDAGLLLPRMTTTQRDAISSPADGLVIFNTTSNCLEYYAGGLWNQTYGIPDVPTVTNPTTGRTWIDRNLGASQVATSSTDAAAYGDLYQWGRLTDGHESRTSGTTTTLSSTDVPGHSNFIMVLSYIYDWRSPQNDNLWQGVSGINNPCLNGFRIPTEAEWNAERLSWSSNNAAGAFGSPLKLTVAGYRRCNTGTLTNVGSHGYYWSSTVSSTNVQILYFNSSNAFMNPTDRAHGYSVRCIKD